MYSFVSPWMCIFNHMRVSKINISTPMWRRKSQYVCVLLLVRPGRHTWFSICINTRGARISWSRHDTGSSQSGNKTFICHLSTFLQSLLGNALQCTPYHISSGPEIEPRICGMQTDVSAGQNSANLRGSALSNQQFRHQALVEVGHEEIKRSYPRIITRRNLRKSHFHVKSSLQRASDSQICVQGHDIKK